MTNPWDPLKISVGSDLSKGRSRMQQLRGQDGLSLFLSLVSLGITLFYTFPCFRWSDHSRARGISAIYPEGVRVHLFRSSLLPFTYQMSSTRRQYVVGFSKRKLCTSFSVWPNPSGGEKRFSVSRDESLDSIPFGSGGKNHQLSFT